jgi:hypothetical protein
MSLLFPRRSVMTPKDCSLAEPHSKALMAVLPMGSLRLDRPVFTIRGSRRGAGEAGHGQEPARGEPLSPTPSFPYFFAL